MKKENMTDVELRKEGGRRGIIKSSIHGDYDQSPSFVNMEMPQ